MLSATWHRRVLEHRHLVALVAAYLLIVGIVLPPTGEYPTYDDGVFAATARDFAERGAMRISDLPSMTLVTHAAWGAGWMLLLGDSWWTLRVATMVMAWIGGLALYALCREFDRTPAEAAAACGSYIFCPLVFALNYTFTAACAPAQSGVWPVWGSSAEPPISPVRRRRFRRSCSEESC